MINSEQKLRSTISFLKPETDENINEASKIVNNAQEILNSASELLQQTKYN
jgi:hypothetical protein